MSHSKPNLCYFAYDFNKHRTILIILGRNVLRKEARKEAVKWYFIFLSRVTSASALHGETESRNYVFSLKRRMLFCQLTRKTHSYYHLVTAELPSFVQKSAVCIKQNQGREYSMLPFDTTHSSFSKSVMMSVAASEVGVVLCQAWSETSAESIGVISYYLNKCYRLSNTLLATILFTSQQHSSELMYAPAYGARNTVQQLLHKTQLHFS